MKKILIVSLLTLASLFSNTLTVYNNNLAYVHETKEISLQKGLQNFKIPNLPQSIIVDSITPIFDKTITLISQSYKNNPITMQKILEANLNEELSFYSKEREKRLLKGKLVNIDPPILESSNHYYIVESSSIIFNKLPHNSDTKPYIMWKLDAKEAKKSTIELSYLLDGMSWSSNYSIVLKQKSLNLKAWATISNQSGKDFKNTTLSLIAGDVNRESIQRAPMRKSYRSKMVALEVAAPTHIAPKALSGYHLYKIPNRVTLLNNQSQQILLFEGKNIRYKRYAIAVNSYFGNYGEQKLKFSQQLVFMNSKENGLGIPMPRGLVRVYKKGYYLGSARIKNTPKGEKIKCNIGEFFDIIGKKKITKYIVRDKYRDIETKYSVQNEGKERIEIRLNETIPRYQGSLRFKSSCSGICSSKKKSAFVREYTITLEPNQSYSFTTEFEVYPQ